MRTVTIAGVLAIGLALAGCGDESGSDVAEPETPTTGSTTSPSPSTDPTPESSDPPVADEGTRCHTPDLTAELIPQGAAAGNHYATLVLTNVSGEACTIFGYGGIQLVDTAGRPLPTEQSRNEQHPPSQVRIQPGQKASSVLHWGVVPTGDEPATGPCQPEPAFLKVIPPDETTQLTVEWPGGPVCREGLIDQWAYAKGVVEPS